MQASKKYVSFFFDFCCLFRKYQLNIIICPWRLKKLQYTFFVTTLYVHWFILLNINRSQNIGGIFYLCLPQLCLDSSLDFRVLLKIKKCVENSWCLNFPSQTLVWTAQSHDCPIFYLRVYFFLYTYH